ncbi:hypothetical protein ATCC90586_010191 [Pythium insidiosum]|nr:hypothetical protein ATCC90586_010191 [Pythium insidiosum]
MPKDLLDDLIAATNGALGLHAFLHDRRRDLPQLVSALSSSTVQGTDVVLRLETLPLRVQRNLWGALVRWPSLLTYATGRALVARYLSQGDRLAKLDTVCVALAQQFDETLIDMEERHDADSARPPRELLLETASELDTALADVVFLPTMVAKRTPTRPAEPATKRLHMEPSPLTPDEQTDAKRPRQETDAPHAPELPREVANELSNLSKQLQSLPRPNDAGGDSAQSAIVAAARGLEQVMNAVHSSVSDHEALFRAACARLELSTTTDEALFQLTTSRFAAIFLETSVRPKILGATSVISRVLLQTALLFSKPNYLLALLDGVVRKVLTDPSIGAPQGEALTRILRECELPAERLDELLLAPALEGRDDIPPLRFASETTVLVVQNVLNLKPTLSRVTVERLVAASHSAVVPGSASDALRKSPKFATLVFTLVSKYSAQCVPYSDELRAIAAQLSSVMAKATQRAIAKLADK